jgi:hypothetical protein
MPALSVRSQDISVMDQRGKRKQITVLFVRTLAIRNSQTGKTRCRLPERQFLRDAKRKRYRAQEYRYENEKYLHEAI